MPPRNILVAVDGSDASLDAVAYADDLADKCGASLTLLYAARPHSTLASRESLRDLERVEHIEIHAEDTLIELGVPAHQILSERFTYD